METLYTWRGQKAPSQEAEKVALAIDHLYRDMGEDKRGLPQEVVNAARSPTSPLHSYFQWDDTKAANQYRKAQARRLIASIVWSRDGGDTWGKAWGSTSFELEEYTVTNGETPGKPITVREYHPLPDIQADPTLGIGYERSLLKHVLAVMESLRDYGDDAFLRAVDELDKVAAILKGRTKGSTKRRRKPKDGEEDRPTA